MSYVAIPSLDLPDFTKGIISIWFRLEPTSITNFATRGSTLDGCIPLLVMGHKGRNIPIETVNTRVLYATEFPYGLQGLSSEWVLDSASPAGGGGPGPPFNFHVLSHFNLNLDYFWVAADPEYIYTFADVTSQLAEQTLPPSYIGIEITDPTMQLRVKFETNSMPTIGSGFATNTVITPGIITGGSASGLEYGVTYHDGYYTTPTAPGDGPDTVVSTTVAPIPDFVGPTTPPVSADVDISNICLQTTGAIISEEINVTPTGWHHALVSVDMITVSAVPGSITSACKLYIAFDDVNYNQGNMASNWVFDLGDNDVAPPEAFDVRFSSGGSYTLSNPSIPINGLSIGVPATVEYSGNIYHIEMAELQMWTDQTLDTSVESNRRLFVDANGKFVDPKVAEAALGVPAVRLHKSGLWIKGKNTGTTGVNQSTGKPIPSGQFIPVGKIKPYKPDPKLGS